MGNALHEIGTGLRAAFMSEDERKNAKYHCGAPGDAPNAYPINSEADAQDAWNLAGHSSDPAHVRACVKRVAKQEGWSLPSTAEEQNARRFDRERCARRNRLAAVRDGVNAMPLRLFQQAPVVAADTAPTLRYAHGALPTREEEILARINALLPDDAPPLAADAVYVHYLEAANDNFVADRYMFMDASTLRNIAKEATAGVAFMNSHQDGSLSHPAALPMGKTFAGRYEEYQDGRKRALVGFYMLRGVAPNGTNAPGTDDLHRTIVGGTTTDASVGLYGGENICDVCGAAVDDYETCQHDPGTHQAMTPEQQLAQRARGVTKGRASYTLMDAHLGEVSAVYDGAVPGAGFRKTLALARRQELSRAALLEASQVYRRLLRKGDLPVDEIGDLIEEHTGHALSRFFGRNRQRASRNEELDEPFAAVQGEVLVQAEPLLSAERQQLERERAELAQQQTEFARQRHWATAEADVERLIREGRVQPAENLPNNEGQPELTAVLALVLTRDAALYGRLLARFAARPAQAVDAERVPVTVFGTEERKSEPTAEDKAARRAHLLSLSPVGQTALKREH